MTDDRELLELAAKAAGYPWRGFSCNGEPLLECDVSKPGPRYFVPTAWNPLTDDGDALGLMAVLGVDVDYGESPTGEPVCWSSHCLKFQGWFEEPLGTEPRAATRRAIVRAAAEIGRNLT